MVKGREKRALLAARHFSHIQQRWIIGLVLAIVIAALRFPWLETDAGNAGFWSYGVFTTDEGYNTSGGRLAYLTGKFLDPELLEPVNFTTSWGMSLISCLGYRLGGLSFGASRLPTICAAIVGWFIAYWLASRVTLPLVACAVTLMISCNPLSLTYERVHSTDVIIGALVILTFCLVTARHLWKAAIGGATLALAIAVKPIAAGLFPLILFGLLVRREHMMRRLAWAAAAFAVSFALLWVVRQMSVTAVGGRSSELVVRTLFSQTAAISVQPRIWLKALSIFPRWPISTQMGPFAIWILVLPFWLLLQGWRSGSLANLRTAIAGGVFIYAAMLAIQRESPIRRLILPVIYFTPALLVMGRATMEQRNADRTKVLLELAVAFSLLFGLYWFPRNLTGLNLSEYLYNEYVIPQMSAWRLSWFVLAIGALALVFTMRRSFRVLEQRAALLLIAATAVATTWIFFGNYTLVIQRLQVPPVTDQIVIQMSLAVFLAVLLVGKSYGRWQIWYGCLLLLFFGAAVLNSHWSRAFEELTAFRYHDRDTSQRLAAMLPPNSIVLGRRSTTLLRHTRCRLGMVMPIWEPAQFFADVERLLKKYPQTPLFVLMDSDPQTPPAIAYLQQMRERFQFGLMTTLEVRADGAPIPVPLYVLRIAYPGG